MPEGKYQIRIETPADVSGLQKTTASTDQTTAALGKLAQQMSNVTKQGEQLSEAEAWMRREIEKTFPAYDGAAKKSDSLNKSKKQLFDGLKKAGQEVPVFGAALNALRNPLTAIGFAIAVTAAKLKDFVNQVDELGSVSQQWDSWNNTFKSFNEVIEKKTGKNQLVEQLKQIKEAAGDADTALSNLNTKLSTKMKAEESVDAASKRNALAQVDADLASKKIDEGTAAKRRAAIEDNFNRRAIDRQKREQAGQIENLRNAQTIAENNVANAQKMLPGAEAAARAAEGRLKVERGRAETFTRGGILFGGKQLSLDEAQKLRNDLASGKGEFLDSFFDSIALNGDERAARRQAIRDAKRTELEESIDTFMRQRSGADAIVQSRERDLNDANQIVSTLGQQIESGQSTAQSLAARRTQLAGNFAIQNSAAQQVASIDASTASIQVAASISKAVEVQAKEMDQFLNQYLRAQLEQGKTLQQILNDVNTMTEVYKQIAGQVRTNLRTQ